MYLQLLVCIAVAHLCYRCSAVPVMPLEADRRSTGVQSSDPRDHDYVLTFFNLRKSFIAANCNAIFNGQRVSPHICNTTAVKAFTSTVERVVDESACNINFRIHLDGYPRERAAGAQLALYKLRETNASEEATYNVYISQNNFKSLSTVRAISSTESGWQLFDIDTADAQWAEDHILTLRVLIIRQDGTTLPCSSALSLFVICTTEKSISHEELFVHTQPQPKEITSYTPVVTVFTSSPSSLSPLCTQLPNSPDCHPGRLKRESPILDLANSESHNTMRDSCSNNHNFVLSIFFFRIVLRPNCTALFNDQTVSALHCNRGARPKFFCALEQTVTKEQSFACDLRFSISTDVGEMVLGADMAMYKLPENETSENVTYDVLIIYQESELYYRLVDKKLQLNSTASGWQVFNVDNVATAWSSGGTTSVVFTVHVTRYNGPGAGIDILSCAEVASLFVLNEPIGNSGSAQPVLYPLEDWEDYIPVLTTFNFRSAEEERLPHILLGLGRKRRSRLTSSLPGRRQPGSKFNEEENGDEPFSRGCQVRNNQVHLQDIFPEATLIEPATINLGQCSASCALDTSLQSLEKPQTVPEDSRAQCKPTKQSDLEVLVRTGNSGPITIQTLTNAIIQECSCI